MGYQEQITELRDQLAQKEMRLEEIREAKIAMEANKRSIKDLETVLALRDQTTNIQEYEKESVKLKEQRDKAVANIQKMLHENRILRILYRQQSHTLQVLCDVVRDLKLFLQRKG